MVTKYLRLLSLPILLILAACDSSGGAGDDSQFIANDGADAFAVTLSDAVLAKNSERWNDYMTLQLEAALVPLNRLSGLLDQTVRITYDECGIRNAFYSPATKSITLCDEIVEDMYNFFAQNDGAERPAQTTNALVFVLYHEIAHALVDILNVSVLGNDESAADGIATVLAVETGRAFSAVVSGVYLSTAPASYADEHTNGQDRFGDISCWALGGDERLLADESLTSLVIRFTGSGRACAVEYEARSSSAMTLIPALIGLSEQEPTDPTTIAADDPNPPKRPSAVPTNSLLQQIANTGNDFWSCSATNADTDVGYRFSGTNGLYQRLDGESGSFSFNYEVSVINDSNLILTYAGNGFVETINNIQFASEGAFTATSDSDGKNS